MKKVRVHPEIEAPEYKSGDVLIVEPEADMLDLNGDEFAFRKGEVLAVEIPGNDNSIWETTGKVVDIDNDDEPLLLMVRVHWGGATLKP